MATKKAINRAASPMKVLEETYDKKPKIVELKKKQLEEEVKHRSPFLIGSIEEVNYRISKLDSELQSYTDLIVESRASDDDDDSLSYQKGLSIDLGREKVLKQEQEAKEIDKFAGVYAIKSTFTPGSTEGLMQASNLAISQSKTAMKMDSRKPLLVEVHTFPGYDANALIPLPHDLQAMEVLQQVVDTQVNIRRKSTYKSDFERLFYSQMSQAILQDVFWWIWLENYMKSGRHYQVKLFCRVAHNYVKLLTYANNARFRDIFLREYPKLLAQSVFAAFCMCFPHSINQFDMDFRENLVNLIFEWVTGMRPAPRTWMKFNFEKLEPKGIKLNDESLTQSRSRKASVLNLDYLDSQILSSRSTVHQTGSVSSVSSITSNQDVPSRNSLHKMASSPLRDVSDAQTAGPLAERKTTKLSQKRSRRSKLMEGEGNEALTPIREHLEHETKETSSPDTKGSRTIQPSRTSIRKKTPESHPIGKGADFNRKVFNLYGQSPLVSHFMQMSNLQKESGMTVHVQRTEMENLPPLDAPTYKQLMGSTYKSIDQFDAAYQELEERNKKYHMDFLKKLQQDKRMHQKRQEALMSKPKEVKRISDILMMELKRDPDSIGQHAKPVYN